MSVSATTTAPQKFLIYIVDDEELLLDIAEVALKGENYALRRFQDPQAALDALTHEPLKPSLLVTDYAMTPLNGLELSARCKSAHPSLKILLVSGTVNSEFVARAPVKVDHFIAKPYDASQFAGTVRSLLGGEAV